VTKQYRRLEALVVTSLAGIFVLPSEAQTSNLPTYTPAQQIVGVIRTWGSPQMGDLLKRYEEGFQKFQPSVRFEDDLKSTVSAVAGVYSGRADIGLLGREIWPTEAQAFESVTGHPAAVIEVATGAFDVPKATYALMIFVNRSNPITALSTEQLDRIFGYAAGRKPIRTWGDLGLQGIWAKRNVDLYGFSLENDKAQIFSRIVFQDGVRWNCHLHEYSNSSGPNSTDAGELILKAVAENPGGIGISNIHYATRDVKLVPLSSHVGEAPLMPTRETVASRRYPLTRAVYVVLDHSADHGISPVTLEFLRYILSSQGQDDVRQEGNYLPLTSGIVEKQRQLLEQP
jgi:phosphate transport system substrate-binding protein